MRADRKATNEWIMGATYLGLVTAICHLRESGRDIEWIVRHVEKIQKECGNEAMQAAGLNGGGSVLSLHDHIKAFAVGLAQQLDQNPTLSR